MKNDLLKMTVEGEARLVMVRNEKANVTMMIDLLKMTVKGKARLVMVRNKKANVTIMIDLLKNLNSCLTTPADGGVGLLAAVW